MSHPVQPPVVMCVSVCAFVCECVAAGSGHKWEWGSCDASLCQGTGEREREKEEEGRDIKKHKKRMKER